MANYIPKNHKHRGGDRLCIGGELRIKDSGKLIVEPGAEVEGLGGSADIYERLDHLTEEIDEKQPKGDYALKTEIPAIPAPYTLPTASADVKGGVKIGEGLQMDGDVLGVKPEPGYELIKAITLEEEVKSIVCGGYYEKALGLKDVYVIIETPNAAANGYVNVYAYGITGFRITAVTITDIITKAQKHSRIEILKKENGYRCSYKSNTIGNVIEWYDMNSESNGEIGKIQIDATTSGVLFPADTKIEIWGVRA